MPIAYIVEYFPVRRFDNQANQPMTRYVLPDLSDAMPLSISSRILYKLPFIGQDISVPFNQLMHTGPIDAPVVCLQGTVAGVRFREMRKSDKEGLPEEFTYFPKVAQLFIDNRISKHLDISTLLLFGYGPESAPFYGFHHLLGLVKGYKVGLSHRTGTLLFKATNFPSVRIFDTLAASLEKTYPGVVDQSKKRELIQAQFPDFLPNEDEQDKTDGIHLMISINSIMSEEMVALNPKHYIPIQDGIDHLPTHWTEENQ